MDTVTIIGGGIAGLTAAITLRERGIPLTLHEAHRTLGVRGRATDPPFVAHDDAHVIYTGSADYAWLRKHGFVRDLGWPSVGDLAHMRFRVAGDLRCLPPLSMMRAQSRRWLEAPVDEDLHSWASARWGETTGRQMASAVAVTTYDADTERLSVAFVWNLFQRLFGPRIPAIRWIRGGWQRVVDRMVLRAIELGVNIETESRVDDLPDGPTIIATDLESAKRLLGDTSLSGTAGHCVLLDAAVDYRRSDITIGFDLDEGGYHESYSMQDDTVAPTGQALFQLQIPVRSDETMAHARERLHTFAKSVIPDYVDRATFIRNGSAKNCTGALDLPRHTWHDRPGIDRGNDVYLVGDMVAAPGMRGEIAINSALAAAESVASTLTRQRS